jgi:tetratricopeptide (TPR) repeat protein
MFISFFLPYIDRGQGPIYRWIMAAQLSRFRPEEIVLIADERYFSAPFRWGETENSFGVTYQNPDIDQWRRVRKIALAEDVFNELETKSLSMLDAFRILLTRDYAPLGEALRRIFADICRETRPEAVLTWCNVPSLESVAAEFNLPVIHNELGPFRSPNYQGTIYFDFAGVNGKTSAARDMAAFLEEVRNKDHFCPLSLEELRRIFMADPSRAREHTRTLFKSGAALQVEDDSNLLAFNQGMNNFELIFAARKGLAPEETLIRRHPKGHLEYGSSLGALDDSADSIQFISRCERIYCTNSSVAFEALLLGKPVYLLGDSPVACLSHERQTGISPRDLLICLNYILIGYLAPISLLFDAEYYRWRLKSPSLLEIYQRHLEIFRRFREDAPDIHPKSKPERLPSHYSHNFSDPSDVLSIGVQWYQNGRFDESLPWFQAILEWNGAHPDQIAEACFHLAEIRRVKHDEDGWRNYGLAGIKILERLDSKDPNRFYKIGRRLYLLHEWPQSTAFLQCVIDSKSADSKQRSESCLMLATIFRQLGDNERWASLVLRAIEEFGPPDPPPWELFEVCIWLYQQNDWIQSRRWCEYLIKNEKLTGGQLAEAYFHLAAICLREGEEQKRQSLMRSGIKTLEAIEPKDASIILKLAEGLRMVGDQPRSLDWLDQLISSEDEEIQAHHFEALSLFFEIAKESNPGERKRHLTVLAKPLLAIGPKKIGSLWRLAEVLVELGMWEKAHEWYMEFLQCPDMHPSQQIEFMAMLAIIDDRLGRNDWGVWLRRMADTQAIHKCQSDEEVYRIASHFKKAGKHLLAVEWFNRAFAMARSDSLRAGVHFHLGELALWQQDDARARDLFGLCLKLNPQHARARSLYADVMHRGAFVG